MMKRMKRWSVEDLELWFPAKRKCFGNGSGHIKPLKLLIGLDPDIRLQEQSLTEKQRQLLKALAGPHSETIKRMLKVKHDR